MVLGRDESCRFGGAVARRPMCCGNRTFGFYSTLGVLLLLLSICLEDLNLQHELVVEFRHLGWCRGVYQHFKLSLLYALECCNDVSQWHVSVPQVFYCMHLRAAMIRHLRHLVVCHINRNPRWCLPDGWLDTQQNSALKCQKQVLLCCYVVTVCDFKLKCTHGLQARHGWT